MDNAQNWVVPTRKKKNIHVLYIHIIATTIIYTIMYIDYWFYFICFIQLVIKPYV